MSNEDSTYGGNDTIDCYPSLERGIKKILVVSEEIFKKLQKDFRLFFKGIRGQSGQRSFKLEAAKGQNVQPKTPEQVFISKFAPREHAAHFQDYEPTNAIYCNTSSWRRWIRVREWFDQYAQTGF